MKKLAFLITLALASALSAHAQLPGAPPQPVAQQVTLTWSPPENCAASAGLAATAPCPYYYVIYRSVAGTSVWGPAGYLGNATTPPAVNGAGLYSWVDKATQPSSSYVYIVESAYQGMQSGPSPTSNTVTTGGVPAPPASVTATAGT